MRWPIILIALVCSVGYGFQNPDPDGQTVEAYGGVGVYGMTSCETLHVYDYRVATAQYKKRWDHWQVGAAAGYINRVERYAVNTETGQGVPLEDRTVSNLGGLMASGSFLHKNVEVTLGLGFLAGKNETTLPWPHAILKVGRMDTAYFGASFADPRPPYHLAKMWVGGYPIPELHIYGGVGFILPTVVSPFFGADWRIVEMFALSLAMGYHVPDNSYSDLDTSMFGSLGFTFYF